MGLPKKLKNYLVFVNGASYAGEIEEVKLPTLKRKMEEYQAAGMTGPIKTDMGQDALEIEFTTGGYLEDVLKGWGAMRVDAHQLRFSGVLNSETFGLLSSLEVIVRGRYEEIDFGSAKVGAKTEKKVKMTLAYYQIAVNGKVLIEYDFANMVEIVNGIDLLAEARTLLGI